ncbi:MAG: hypothetical protein WCL39_07425, partial [Armatimonadota bacterium]
MLDLSKMTIAWPLKRLAQRVVWAGALTAVLTAVIILAQRSPVRAQTLDGAKVAPAVATVNSLFMWDVNWAWDIRWPWAKNRITLRGPEEVQVGAYDQFTPIDMFTVDVTLSADPVEFLVGVGGVFIEPNMQGTNYFFSSAGVAGTFDKDTGRITLQRQLPNPLPVALTGKVYVSYVTNLKNTVSIRLPIMEGVDDQHQVYT